MKTLAQVFQAAPMSLLFITEDQAVRLNELSTQAVLRISEGTDELEATSSSNAYYDELIQGSTDRYIDVTLTALPAILLTGFEIMLKGIKEETGDAYDTDGKPRFKDAAIKTIEWALTALTKIVDVSQAEWAIPLKTYDVRTFTYEQKLELQQKFDERSGPVKEWLKELAEVIEAA